MFFVSRQTRHECLLVPVPVGILSLLTVFLWDRELNYCLAFDLSVIILRYFQFANGSFASVYNQNGAGPAIYYK